MLHCAYLEYSKEEILWLAELFRRSDSSISTSPVQLPDPKFSMERRGRRNVIQPHTPLGFCVASYLLLMMSLGCKMSIPAVYRLPINADSCDHKGKVGCPPLMHRGKRTFSFISGVHPAAYDLHRNHLEALIEKMPPP
ncbi:hypothetical protein BDN67DRAFT_664842 [Paxillus ammoniavirescens]|nr:hypothetical protein BDN67DRAFT_664842 [Paxillus ammoniavirescens]